MKSKNIFDYFGDLPEPREDNKRHHLLDIITIVICASICGAETWEDISAYKESKKERFRRFLELPHGIPSKGTFRKIFALIAPEELNRSEFAALHNTEKKSDMGGSSSLGQ